MNAVIEQSTFTIHPVMIQEEAEEMAHQFSHMLEQQRMSMDQYLMLLKKTREEYLKELEPDAEKRVKRQLVLDEVIKKEEISVAPEEVEALFRAYTQMGQSLPQTEGQIRALAQSLLREKAITRLVELTTEPEIEASEEESSEETQVEFTEAAVLADKEETMETQMIEVEENDSQPSLSASEGGEIEKTIDDDTVDTSIDKS
jgi:trigger factor